MIPTLLILWVVISLVTGALAARKGYNFILWALAAGILGLIILAFLPFCNKPNQSPEVQQSQRKTGNTIGAVLAVLGVLICVVARLMSASAGAPPGPHLVCTSFDFKAGEALVVLTNATTHSWTLALYSVRGVPTPSYFIRSQKMIAPGWGIESEEGIYCSGLLYRRDSAGKYSPPEKIGNSARLRLTVSLTNVILRPQEFLTFSVPAGEIHGLSKVGVKYNWAGPRSSLSRSLLAARKQLRRWLHFKPARQFPGWCETFLPMQESEKRMNE